MSNYTSFYTAEKIFTEFDGFPRVIDTAHPDFQQARELAILIFTKLQPIRNEFIKACFGKPYKNVPSETLSFPDLFMKQELRKANFLLQELRSLIDTSFDLGLLYHLFCNQFPTRSNLNRVDFNKLFAQWAPKSLVADVLSRDYDEGNKQFPSTIQRVFFEVRIEPFLKKQLKLGFWTRGKTRSWFRNVFFAGVRLGLLYDLQTKE